MTGNPHTTWTAAEIQALGLTTDVVTAGRILGMSRNTAYLRANDGTFPVPVLRMGHRMRVSVAALLTLLDLPTTGESDDTTDADEHTDNTNHARHGPVIPQRRDTPR